MFDTHAHLSDKLFYDELPELLLRASAEGIRGVISICSDLEERERFRGLIKENQSVWGAYGIHPHDAGRSKEELGLMGQIFELDKVVAVGEIGLDYHYENSDKSNQKEVFIEQLRFAKRRSLPVIIHSRDSMQETLKILSEESPGNVIMHCFSGDNSELDECMKRGYYVSVAGPVTYKNAENIRFIAVHAHESRLLTETDAPYLTPAPYRGKRNEPSFLRFNIEKIAAIREKSYEDMGEILYRNALTAFNIRDRRRHA